LGSGRRAKRAREWGSSGSGEEKKGFLGPTLLTSSANPRELHEG